MLGGEVRQRMHASGAQAASGKIESASVLIERIDQLVDAGWRGDGRGRDDRGVGTQSLERRAQVGDRATSLAHVGFRHHQHVRDLHDSGLQELEHVARAGLDHDGDRVGDIRDLGL